MGTSSLLHHSWGRSEVELNFTAQQNEVAWVQWRESYTIAYLTPCPPEYQGLQYCTVVSFNSENINLEHYFWINRKYKMGALFLN